MMLKVLTIIVALAAVTMLALVVFGGALAFLSPEPGGVTVLVRQPYQPRARSDPAPRVAVAPVDATAAPDDSTISVFAVDLGAALSFSELSARFALIATDNAEAGFERLQPRATIEETADGLRARLLVGPVATRAAAEAICAGLALPGGIRCRAVPMAGEVIARQ